jgi:hypothetical protein
MGGAGSMVGIERIWLPWTDVLGVLWGELDFQNPLIHNIPNFNLLFHLRT